MFYRNFHLSTYPCGSTKLHHISIIDLYPWYYYYWSWPKVVYLLLRIMKLEMEENGKENERPESKAQNTKSMLALLLPDL